MSIERLERGRWKVTVDVGNGTRRRVARTITGSRRAAERLERTLRSGDYHREDRPDPSTVTVADVCDRYVAKNRERWKPNTRNGYLSKLDSIVRPAWGDLLLDDIDEDRIEDDYRALQRGQRVGGLTPRRKLAARTVVGAHRFTAAAFADATRTRYLPDDPWQRVRPPSAPSRVVKRFDPAEVGCVLYAAAARGDKDLADIVQLAIATGARQGELCALRWRDVTLTTGVVLFDAVSTKDDGQTVRLPTLKAALARPVRVDEQCRRMLEDRYRRHVVQAEAAGVPVSYLDDVAVCSRMLERDATSGAAVSARWRRAAQAAPSDLRFHDLRKIAVSALMAAGLGPIVAAARAGNSPRIAMEVYGHLYAEDDARVTDALSAVWAAVAH